MEGAVVLGLDEVFAFFFDIIFLGCVFAFAFAFAFPPDMVVSPWLIDPVSPWLTDPVFPWVWVFD